MTEVTLVPPVSEGRESYRIRVTVDGAKVFDAPRKSLREGGAARRDSLLEQMQLPSSWPAEADRTSEDAWRAKYSEAQTRWANPSRATEMAHLRLERSSRWCGSRSKAQMARHGFDHEDHAVDPELLTELRDALARGRAAEVKAARKPQKSRGTKMCWRKKRTPPPPAVVHGGTHGSDSLMEGLCVAGGGEGAAEQSGPHVRVRTLGEEAGGRALREIVAQVNAAAGMTSTPYVERLWRKSGAKPSPPDPWHGDAMSAAPKMAAVVPLSGPVVPPVFPDIGRDWGFGDLRECHWRKGTKHIEARCMRWRRVHEARDNMSELVATQSPSGAEVGLTARGNARGVPRKTQYCDPSRRKCPKGGRPTVRLGSATFFDATGPHRGPGVAQGERGDREVLYLSWADKTVEESRGQPVYARRPEAGVEGEDYLLAFDGDGIFLMETQTPRTVGERRKAEKKLDEEKKAKRPRTWLAKAAEAADAYMAHSTE